MIHRYKDVHVIVPWEVYDWLTAQAAHDGMPMATLAQAIWAAGMEAVKDTQENLKGGKS